MRPKTPKRHRSQEATAIRRLKKEIISDARKASTLRERQQAIDALMKARTLQREVEPPPVEPLPPWPCVVVTGAPPAPPVEFAEVVDQATGDVRRVPIQKQVLYRWIDPVTGQEVEQDVTAQAYEPRKKP
jgi:hypothetical protein